MLCYVRAHEQPTMSSGISDSVVCICDSHGIRPFGDMSLRNICKVRGCQTFIVLLYGMLTRSLVFTDLTGSDSLDFATFGCACTF